MALALTPSQTVGLPGLDHRVRHRLALAVEHAAADPYGARRAVRHDERAVVPRQPDREVRADGLRWGELERHQWSSSIGVASRPVSTMSNSYASAHCSSVDS